MDFEDVFVTSRSKAPSLIDVTSRNEKIFEQLPDLIQEAAVSTEFSSQRICINRAHDPPDDIIFMTRPMFYISSRQDSGVDLPNLVLDDEEFINKYGSDLAANFADIRAHGADAFFQKENTSNGVIYSLSACATGYIWVYVSSDQEAMNPIQEVEIQIGTFSLQSRTITTVEVPCRFKSPRSGPPKDGQLARLCATVLAKYLRLRTMGQQYEEATEIAIRESRQQLSPLPIVDPGLFDKFDHLLQQVCTNAPLPPISDVSMISRSMITGRWQSWKDSLILRRRYSLPRRVILCFKKSPHNPIALLSDTFSSLTA